MRVCVWGLMIPRSGSGNVAERRVSRPDTHAWITEASRPPQGTVCLCVSVGVCVSVLVVILAIYLHVYLCV